MERLSINAEQRFKSHRILLWNALDTEWDGSVRLLAASKPQIFLCEQTKEQQCYLSIQIGINSFVLATEPAAAWKRSNRSGNQCIPTGAAKGFIFSSFVRRVSHRRHHRHHSFIFNEIDKFSKLFQCKYFAIVQRKSELKLCKREMCVEHRWMVVSVGALVNYKWINFNCFQFSNSQLYIGQRHV